MKLRRVAKIFAAIIVLVIALLLAAPLFISAEFLKGQLIAQVKKTTGRTLTIQGKTSLTLFPNIAVRAENVTLGNPAGFSAPYFAHLDVLETGAALMPLFHRELNITGVTLAGATLNLEQNSSGAKNWEFTQEKVKQEAAKEAATSAAAPASSPLDKFALGDVKISKTAVNYNVAGKPAIAVKDITLTISGADGAAPLKLEGSANYQGQDVKAKLQMARATSFLNGELTPTKFSLSLPSATVEFDGKASLKNGATASGALEVKVDDLPKLLAWATGKPAAGSTPKQVALDGNLVLDGTSSIAFDPFKGSVNGAAASGKLAINLAGAVPTVTGSLNLGTLDLAAVQAEKAAPVATSGAGGAANAAAAPAAEGWSDAPLDLSGLRAVNANLALKADAIASGKLMLGATSANVNLAGGVLKLALNQMALYGGNASGNVTVNGSAAGAGIATALTLSGVKIEPLMTALSGTSRVEGTLTTTLNVTGSGASERALVRSLNGNGTLKIADGAVKGANLAQFWRNAKSGFLFNSPNEATDFSALTASYTITNGIVNNSDLAVKAPALRISGSGSVNLPERTLNYKLVPMVVETSKGVGGKDDLQGISVPLLITGPWANPQVTPDVKGIVTDALKNPEQFKQNLQNLKGTLKNFNSPKDLKRALFGGSSAN